MSKTTDRPPIPQSMRHKRILMAAEQRPDASLQDLASEIPTATVDLVENVLEKYGDPAEEDQGDPETDVAANGSSPASDEPPDELTVTQRETLEAIAERPDATQRDLAEQLEVAPATICNRVKSIQGFEWDERRAFVERMSDIEIETNNTEFMATSETQLDTRFEQFDERLSALEESVADRSDNGVFDDPDLVHKVVHACMDAETIDEDEELRIIEAILR